MDNFEIKKIDEIYHRYGYDISEEGGVRIYKYTRGRYLGVDIFDYSNSNMSEKIRDEYAKLGYAVLIRNYKTYEEAELELFASLFNVVHFKKLVNLQYNDFRSRQSLSLSVPYEYIKCNYNCMRYDEEGYPIFEVQQEGYSVVNQVADLVFEETNKSLFVIIEAAAGYGKTCSSYELLNALNSRDDKIIPMYIELSRNREARIFKHILLNEIDLQFQHSITSENVIYEIKQGRIPLIIDGFDELLSKDISKDDKQLRDAESMLSTIVELLDSKAKIIITSRRTAIFDREEFFEWMQNSSIKYNVARYSLSTPNILDWLSQEQIDMLDQYNFPIQNISNPVLLSYIRHLQLDELQQLLSNDMAIIDTYFDFLLKRERTRQTFSFTNEEQLRIIRKLVRIMTEFDIKSEKKSFIKEIIKEYNKELLENYIKNSKITPKPTIDELSDTLSNHALLDRKKNDEIGFINEFIFGLLIGQNLLLGKYQEHSPETYTAIISQDFATLAVSSYISKSKYDKEKLWDIFNNKSFKYNADFNIYKDISLLGNVSNNYVDSSITNMEMKDIKFLETCSFKNFVFSDCVFRHCNFSFSIIFNNSGFVNCRFFDCIWEPNNRVQENYQAFFSGCSDNNGFVQQYDNNIINEDLTEETPLEKLILEYFIRDGRKYKDMVNLSKIREDFSDRKKLFDKVINHMENIKLLALNGGKCFLLKNAINYYRENFL